MKGWWSCMLAVLERDLRAECRAKERLGPMAFFLASTLLVFCFSLGPSVAGLDGAGAGVLWSSFVLASVLGLNRSFAEERENACLDALLLAPADRGAVFTGKMLANFAALACIQAAALPAFAVLFNLDLGRVWLRLLGVFLLGGAALSAVGTLFAALSSSLRLRETLLPVLLLPVAVPVLIAATDATSVVLTGGQLGDCVSCLAVLAVAWLVFYTLAIMLIDRVLEE